MFPVRAHYRHPPPYLREREIERESHQKNLERSLKVKDNLPKRRPIRSCSPKAIWNTSTIFRNRPWI